MLGHLPGLSPNNITGNYFWNLEETQKSSWIPELATEVPSDQAFEVHKWLGEVPALREFDGERKRQELKDNGLTIVNRKFTSTITADVDDLELDKSGGFQKRISELGSKAATLPQRIFTQLLTANGTAYDGSNFFASSHAYGGSCDNDLSENIGAPDAPTVTEFADAILKSIEAIIGVTDATGDPANEFAKKFLVMVPTKYWRIGREAMGSDSINTKNNNPLKSSGMQIELVVNPRLPGTNDAAGRRIYTGRTDAPIKPFIWQERAIKDALKTLGIDSEGAFWREEIAVGAKRISNGALGRFELMNRTNFT